MVDTAPGSPGLAGLDQLLQTRGIEREADGFVVGCAASRDGRSLCFATGEGSLFVVPRAAAIAEPAVWRRVDGHDGAVLSLAPDATPGGFLSGGDDNALRRLAGADAAEPETLATGRRWVEHVASFFDGRNGLIAAAIGKQVELRDARGALLRTLEHPSTVGGVAFDAKGKRVAASHYGGASVWFTASKNGAARELNWKGSHLAVALHPAGEAVVTAMQECELHGWRLEDAHNMRMSGYPQKTESLCFSRNGRWLATGGAEVVVLWPFSGGGPMGKAPTELAGVPEAICTRVAFHPQHDIVAAGFSDGTVLMSDVGSKRVLPVCGPGRGKVSALCFSPDGGCLLFGTEAGRMAVVDLSQR
ncbi:WD40 repeat domain-containing protein [Rhizosaccharibacter radicis]|uniref:WD40 repeat domain-containing protein n=1 Tax=Rhizosaccharibacter radicis TaxID=2782605 RepID=A0ABT1VTD5_9PROT|nr:WD40 repeat domain-containing protein [Acetobacteraceae bacterium KSS12]